MGLAEYLPSIDIIGQMAWDHLIGPITKQLTNFAVKRIFLIPQGGLGILPLHAAWHSLTDVGRKYLMDDYIISYIPSVYLGFMCQKRLHDIPQEHDLFAVLNPTEDLEFSLVEGQQIANLFGSSQARILSGKEATSTEIKHKTATYLHYACHGYYDWLSPMKSGLVLAKGELLTLVQIINELNLKNTRLVTISACETGITDILQSPDEYLGLSAGFLQAGAPGVVSTLWAVNDLSTMLLMERFYKLHLQDMEDVASALCEAQRWLRDVTAGELAKRFAAEEEAAFAGNPRMPIKTASEAFTHFATLDPAARPFLHPYYWAAFTFSGA